MSDDLIRDFFDKSDELKKIHKQIETRLNNFFATLGQHLRGYDDENKRERWRSVNLTTMGIPSSIIGNYLISPTEWLTLEELGRLLNSWHNAIDEAGKAWRRLPYQDQQRFAKDEPPDY